MKIAVVGKGGSGKSTISWGLTCSAARDRKAVLAIDADYNLDLARLLKISLLPRLLQTAEPDFYQYQDLKKNDLYVDLPKRSSLVPFSLVPLDSFSSQFVTQISPAFSPASIQFMAVGGTHKAMLYGNRCSHAYFAPLKYYLPLLQLPQEGVVVVDSVAGIDMVAYGLVLGVDLIVSVVEPTPQSIAVHHEVEKIAREFSIPLVVLGNKVGQGSSKRYLEELQRLNPLHMVPFDEALLAGEFENISSGTSQVLHEALQQCKRYAAPADEAWRRHRIWRDQSDKFSQNVSG